MKKLLIILLFSSCTYEATKVAVFKRGDSISLNPNKPTLYEGYLKNDSIYLKRIR